MYNYLQVRSLQKLSATILNMASLSSEIQPTRRRLARIRCVKECVEQFRDHQPLPRSLCFVPAQLVYSTIKSVTVSVLSSPNVDASVIAEVKMSPKDRLLTTGEELCNSFGQWSRVSKVFII